MAPWRSARRDASAFERSISTSAGSRPAASSLSNLKAFTSAPLPERLGEDQAVAGARPLIGEQALRVAVADDRQSELELLVADRVAAQDRGAGRGAGRRAAGEDPCQDLRRSVGREAAEVEREERPPAHGVDVRDGVGRGDAAEAPRIVADRRNEVGRRDERLAAEEHHAGVVEGLRVRPARVFRDRRMASTSQPAESVRMPAIRRALCAGRPGRSSRRSRRRRRPARDGDRSRSAGESDIGSLRPGRRLGGAPDVGDDLQMVVSVDAEEAHALDRRQATEVGVRKDRLSDRRAQRFGERSCRSRACAGAKRAPRGRPASALPAGRSWATYRRRAVSSPVARQRCPMRFMPRGQRLAGVVEQARSGLEDFQDVIDLLADRPVRDRGPPGDPRSAGSKRTIRVISSSCPASCATAAASLSDAHARYSRIPASSSMKA